MKKSISILNTLELTFGLFVFFILKQFSTEEVRVIFMLPVILLTMLPSGRFKQPILTTKNKFDMIYSFIGTLVILMIVFVEPSVYSMALSGETTSISYFIGFIEFPIEQLTVINNRATSLVVKFFLTAIPAISLLITVGNDILKNGLIRKNHSTNESINIFSNEKESAE
ncbi:MAG: hypothetical protein JEZ05_08690 [Tenericutes bacterium]|nr:hypothetical protein [Mycoplasmatota bacterium]